MTTFSPHYVSLEFSEEAKRGAFAPAPVGTNSSNAGVMPGGMASFASGITSFIRETGGEGIDIVEDNRDEYAKLENRLEAGAFAEGAEPGSLTADPGRLYDQKTEHLTQSKACVFFRFGLPRLALVSAAVYMNFTN